VGKANVKLVGLAVRNLQPREISLLDNLAEAGFKPRFGSIGPRSGIAAGLLFERWSPLFLETAISIRGSQRHIGGLAIDRGNYLLSASYMFQRDAEPHFWGNGLNSNENEFVAYRRDRQEISLAGTLRRSSVTLSAGAGYQDNSVRRSYDNDELEIVDLPDSIKPYGVDERTKYVLFDLNAGFDRSRFTGFSRTGYYLEVGSALFLGTDGTDSDFWRVNGQFTGFVPVNPRQALALRGIAEYNQGYGQGVPFTHLAVMGDLRGGRAYRQNRFSDLAMLAVMSEWRYEVWRELHERGRAETFFLADAGTVSNSFRNMSLKQLRWSFGLGLRLVFESEVRWLAWLAFGRDGAEFSVRFTRVF
jgi:outer membrane protein assembly factor BamA